MSPIKFLAFLIFLFVSASSAAVEDASFGFSSFTLRNLTLLGDSYLRGGVMGLTRELEVPSSSSGTFLYNRPVSFLDPASNATASFATRFTFSVTNLNPASSGDGLAFFLSPDSHTLGSPGAFLALANSSKPTQNRFVAVEFDTRLDARFNDPSDNHVGLDIDTLESINSADCSDQGVFLKSGKSITAWIDYNSGLKTLNVFLSYSASKPLKPLLAADIDLSAHLNQFMYVGFSGATDGSTELHLVSDWTFRTSGFSPPRPKLHPHNVSDSSVTVTDPYIPVPSHGSGNKHQNKLAMGLGISGPAFFCIALIVFGFITLRKWRGIRTDKSFKVELLTGRPREFSYRELRSATRGFHSSRILGHGAFGTVYKACFNSSGAIAIAAVKRSKHSHEGKTEFLAELSIIGCLRHKNLVQLQGWCVEKNELLLVYDFMPHGSLDKTLYPDSGQALFLNWSLRYNIAVGMASVLSYLHDECEQQVIHRDIKASNIMLDKNFNARLGDFGLARIMDHDKSPVSTLTAGTMGYLAPEYLQYGKATEKTDAFSYGVVVLEVACGRRPIEREENSQRMVNLVDWVWGLHSQGKIMEAADRRLDGAFDGEEMRKLLLIGLSCANPDSSQRPSMRRVVQILNKEAELGVVPTVKPTLMFSCGLPLSLDDIVSDAEG